MKKYKLTTQEMKTYNGTQWEIGVAKETDGSGELCSKGWLHYYDEPELAAFFNPIHANISNPRLWICEVEGEQKDDNGLKGGCTKLTLLEEITIPTISTEQRVKIAILCSL